MNEYLAAEAAAAEAAAAEASRDATVESVAAMAEAEAYRRAAVEDEATLALEEAEQLHREAEAATAELGVNMGVNMDASPHEAARISVQHAAAVVGAAEAQRGGAVAGIGVAHPLETHHLVIKLEAASSHAAAFEVGPPEGAEWC